jgi:hypothetical protein
VASPDSAWDDEIVDAGRLLAEFEREYRDDLPGTPPPLSLPAAVYGARMMYRACQFLAYRDIGAEVIRQELSQPIDQPIDSPVHYSVDVTLRFLPDAVRLVRAAASGDQLGDELVRLANHWPLSAVGIDGAEAGNLDTLVADPCLLQMYVDRILARGDVSRLADDRVKQVAARTLGAHPELAPAIAAALNHQSTPLATRDTSG